MLLPLRHDTIRHCHIAPLRGAQQLLRSAASTRICLRIVGAPLFYAAQQPRAAPRRVRSAFACAAAARAR